MESFGGPRFSFAGCTSARKKRSRISRQPRGLLETFLHKHSYDFVTSPPHGIVQSSIEDKNIKNGAGGLGNEKKLKLKLKLGGVTCTIHTNSMPELAFGGVQKFSSDLYASQSQESSLLKVKDCGLHGNGCSKSGSGHEKGHRDNASGTAVSANETDQYEPTRKSKRVRKRRVLDVGFNSDDDDEDEEIRYLGRLNASNRLQTHEDQENISNKKNSQIHGDTDYFEEEKESDDEPELKKRRQGKGSIEIFVDGRNESTPTTHNRALQSGKDASTGPGAGVLEFPDGLPPALPKKQKEKPSELEQQLKKAEAARRRKMQSEKAAREAEAEAIRKILGQDSGRKKKEDKMKQQQDDLAKAKPDMLEPNTIRWVMGPTGSIIIFSEDIGLPSIFNSRPCSYPPPREKCAGPNCTNTYKYRDSKSKLPLCSLNCYKAIQEKRPSWVAC